MAYLQQIIRNSLQSLSFKEEFNGILHQPFLTADAYPYYDLVLEWDKSGAYEIKETSVAEYNVASITTESGRQRGGN